MESPLAENELARLDTLRSVRILDTPPEQAFDDLTRLTSFICGTPIAFIGFMDADRLWFKSRIGWDVAEVPREMSFCSHTILQSDVLVVEDTLADQGRLANCPLATHGGIRFYAGASLMSSEGCALGTLCAMDSIPRGLTPGQTDALRRLARQVVVLVESRRLPKPLLNTNPVQKDSQFSDHTTTIQGLSFWRDISEQKQAAQALRHSQERLLGIISSAMDAIITIDNDQKIIVFNRAAEQIFHCPATEAIGQSIDKFVPERFREVHANHIRGFGQTGVSSRSMESPGTLMGVRADGQEFPIEATISQVKTPSERLYTVILRDISVRMRIEDELRQAQKMEAVGNLAGGIAHEFNNYLGIIMGYSDLMAQEDIQNESLRLGLAEIKSAAQKGASLTRQLLAFSRKQLIEPTVIDLNASVWDAHKLLRRLIPANIDLVPVLQSDLGKVKADPSQIQQILINLVVNARDAMPEGGKIRIETAEVVLDEEFTSRHVDVVPGDYIVLTVCDNGEGIDSEILPHIFEPFFTTKKADKGTGLGLSTIYGIVKQSGGHVIVASVRGKGTTFHVYFPKLAESPNSIGARETPMSVEFATVLLVEDESGLRKLMRATLERHNYRVLEAEDGAAALSIFQDNLAQINIVVTDLSLPKITGLQLKHKVLALQPNMRFLLISGYLEEVIGSPDERAEVGDFLEKPFFPDELLRKVREILGRASRNQEVTAFANRSTEPRFEESDTERPDPRFRSRKNTTNFGCSLCGMRTRERIDNYTFEQAVKDFSAANERSILTCRNFLPVDARSGNRTI